MDRTFRKLIRKHGNIDMLKGNTYYDNLNLSRCTELTALPENLTVVGTLNLSYCTQLTSLPKNLTVKKKLRLYDCTGLTSLSENLTVGDDLDLTGCTGLTSLPKSLTVGRCLYLSDCTGLTTLPGNRTVRGTLGLSNCTGLTSLPKHLTVGSVLDLKGTGITDTTYHVNKKVPPALFWQDGKYIEADNIFSRVISHHGNVYRVVRIGRDKEQYLVTDGNSKWAHGDTLAKAKEDLKFKIVKRDTGKYWGLPLDHEFSEEQAIECYRIITGACAAGVKDFLQNELPKEKRKKRYTIAQIIELTEGQYGAEMFKMFFTLPDDQGIISEIKRILWRGYSM